MRPSFVMRTVASCPMRKRWNFTAAWWPRIRSTACAILRRTNSRYLMAGARITRSIASPRNSWRNLGIGTYSVAMITNHTPDTLKEFEQQIAEDFNAGKIRAPVHLAGGNEEQLIDIFSAVTKSDWVLTQWRSHYHCLLKGVPPERLRADILAGRSITL